MANSILMEEVKRIKNLDPMEGSLLFFGGVYSNLQSLQALQTWTIENGYDPGSIICTGDVLGYCAQPLECIELMRDWGIHCIAGNVELQIRNNEQDCGCDFTAGGRCDLFSRTWYRYAQSKMNGEAMEWLHTLPHHLQFKYGTKKVTVVHGSWFHTSEFVFASTPWEVKEKNFEAAGTDIIVGGHCGLPFASQHAGKLWLNAGVVGMPANDGTDRVWFATLHNEGGTATHRFVSYRYNHPEASDLMRQNGLPLSYAQTLRTGIWDNCEILPEEETQQQGKALHL